MVHPVQKIPWKRKGKLHSGSAPATVAMVGQEEVLDDVGGVGPGIEQVRKLIFIVGL